MNGAVERSYGTIKGEFAGVEFADFYAAEGVIREVIDWYNNERLHSALNYLKPVDYQFGSPERLLGIRRWKLERARRERARRNKNLEVQSGIVASVEHSRLGRSESPSSRETFHDDCLKMNKKAYYSADFAGEKHLEQIDRQGILI